MDNQIITREDMNFLAQQSSDKLNLILSGMTALLRDNDSKVEALQSQNWFQRMCKTVTGKNKCTRQEIQQNHEKLNQYMIQAMTELYQQNCIDRQIMMSLGNQINTIYAEQLQLQQMLGVFASQLNEKIESVDNFHILNTEIEQGVYSNGAPIVAVCKIMSQMDRRCVEDERKLDILRRSMEEQNILNGNEITLQEYLMGIVQIPMEEVGIIYMELCSIRSNFIADLVLKMIESYHLLPDMARKMKNKQSVVESVIRNEQLEPSAALSINDVYDELITSKSDMLGSLVSIGISDDNSSEDEVVEDEPVEDNISEDELQKATELFLSREFDEAFEIFSKLAENGNGRAMYFLGEYYNHSYGHISKDSKEGNYWYMRGTRQGNALAAFHVSDALRKDCQEDERIFKELFDSVLSLARDGDIFAQTELLNFHYSIMDDELYSEMMLLEMDVLDMWQWRYDEDTEEECLKWLRKAAEQGYWVAQKKLGDFYLHKDKYEAVKWYTKAAEQGYAEAKKALSNHLL